MENKKYPYLGKMSIDNKQYVVLFNEPDNGMIVMSDFDDPKLKFATYGSFDESKFTVLSPEECVRISN